MSPSDPVTSDQLIAAFKSRALFYLAIYNEMKQDLGADKASELMRRALYKRGVEIGAQFQTYAPDNLGGLRDAFLAFIPDHAHTFRPDVIRCDAGELEIKFHSCPLKNAWREAGLAADEIANMCSIAGTVDNGTFEGAGFRFSAATWREGAEGCCHLHIRPGKRDG